MSTQLRKFKFAVPTYTYFYTPVSAAALVEEMGRRIVGDWQGRFVHDGVSVVLVEEPSFAEPGLYFLGLLEKGETTFTNRLFEIGTALTLLADDFQKMYASDVENNTVTHLSDFYPRYSSVFTPAIGLGYSLDYALDVYIRTHKIDPASIIPAGISFQSREKSDLRKIFEVEDTSTRELALLRHSRKYAWLLNTYTGEHPTSIDYFRNRKEEVLGFKTHESKVMRSMPQSMMEWMSYLIFMRDERKRGNMMANGFLDRYLTKECTERKIEKKSATLCTIGEFELLKTDPDNFPKRSERILKFTDKGAIDMSTPEWEHLATELSSDEKMLKGQVASKGFARGTARIVLEPSDFKKVQKGDVIVASMTRPEYAPILGLCAAIVTNEGGITCHASIVSREMKIPCIIGTQKATQIFKDGDVVEVDAENGVVRIVSN